MIKSNWVIQMKQDKDSKQKKTNVNENVNKLIYITWFMYIEYMIYT